jgi:hypothetical protein
MNDGSLFLLTMAGLICFVIFIFYLTHKNWLCPLCNKKQKWYNNQYELEEGNKLCNSCYWSMKEVQYARAAKRDNARKKKELARIKRMVRTT